MSKVAYYGFFQILLLSAVVAAALKFLEQIVLQIFLLLVG